MKIKRLSQIVLGASCGAFLLLPPLPTAADNSFSPGPFPVIITELQTGSSPTGKGDEFVELYNAGNDEVDITGWQVSYQNASSVPTVAPTLIGRIVSQDAGPVILAPHEYYLLHTDSITRPAEIKGQTFAAKLSNADKGIALFAPDPDTCAYAVQDAVGWNTSDKIEGEGLAASAASEKLVQRMRDEAGLYIDTNNNAHDFVLSAAEVSTDNPHLASGTSMGSDNLQNLPTDTPPPSINSMPTFVPMAVDGCVVPVPDDGMPDPPNIPVPDPDPVPDDPALPPASPGLPSPKITELLPNPAAPQTDAEDEYIELYNPNELPFDLSGYTLEAGIMTKRRYVFPEGTVLEPASFKAFFSAETKLSLSNTSGQVTLLDPSGVVVSRTDPYGTAKDGQTWSLVDGQWVWSAAPTPNGANIAAAVLAAKTQPKKTAVPKAAKAKATSTKTTAAKKTKEVPPANTIASTQPSFPIHTYTLALIGVSALLYGAYEYRGDMANKYHQFRANRAARRSARQKPKGR